MRRRERKKKSFWGDWLLPLKYVRRSLFVVAFSRYSTTIQVTDCNLFNKDGRKRVVNFSNNLSFPLYLSRFSSGSIRPTTALLLLPAVLSVSLQHRLPHDLQSFVPLEDDSTCSIRGFFFFSFPTLGCVSHTNG